MNLPASATASAVALEKKRGPALLTLAMLLRSQCGIRVEFHLEVPELAGGTAILV